MNTKGCPLSRCFHPWGSGLQSLGFALMAGGMLALGAFTAPVVFGQLPRTEAGPIMGVIFRRYDIVLQVALGLALLGECLRLASRQVRMNGPLPLLRWLLLAGLTVTLLYSTLFVNADIERMNRAGMRRDITTVEGRKFEASHKLSEGLYKADLLMVFLLILITPFCDAKPTSTQPSQET